MILISSQIGGLDWGNRTIQMANGRTRSQTLSKVCPNPRPGMPYLAILGSRLEIGLDDLNFIPNVRIGMELYSN